MSDIIFWYTGAAVWGIIAIIVALGVLLSAVVACAKAFHAAGRWTLWVVLGTDPELMARAIRDLMYLEGSPSVGWLNRFRDALKKNKP